MHALVLLLLAQPGDVVQTFDLGTISWQRAKALEGRRVRVRFTVDRIASLVGPIGAPEVVEVLAVGPENELRSVSLLKCNVGSLNGGARLEAEGVLRATWNPVRPGIPAYFAVELSNARLVK